MITKLEIAGIGSVLKLPVRAHDEENKRLREELVNERIKRICAEKDVEIAVAKKDTEIANAKKDAEAAKKDTEVARKDAEAAKKDAEVAVANAKKDAENLRAVLAELRERFAEQRATIDSLKDRLAEKNVELERKNTEIVRKEGEVKQVTERLVGVASGRDLSLAPYNRNRQNKFFLVQQQDEQYKWLEMISGQSAYANDTAAEFRQEDIVHVGYVGAPIPLRNRLRERLKTEMTKRAAENNLSVRDSRSSRMQRISNQSLLTIQKSGGNKRARREQSGRLEPSAVNPESAA